MRFATAVFATLAVMGCVVAAPHNAEDSLTSEAYSSGSLPEFIKHALRARADEPAPTKTSTAPAKTATSTSTAKPTETETTSGNSTTTATNTTTTTATKTSTSAKPTATAKPTTTAAASGNKKPCGKWEDYNPKDPNSCKLTSAQVVQFFNELGGGGGGFDVSAADSSSSTSDSAALGDLTNPNAAGGVGVILGLGDGR